jgi:hypothetical protein
MVSAVTFFGGDAMGPLAHHIGASFPARCKTIPLGSCHIIFRSLNLIVDVLFLGYW